MDLNATIIGQIIAFFVFVWFCQRYVWPPITKAMEDRQKKIADGLEAASRADHDLALAQERAAALLKEAKTSSAGIIDQANKRANQIIDEAKEKARLSKCMQDSCMLVQRKASRDAALNSRYTDTKIMHKQ